MYHDCRDPQVFYKRIPRSREVGQSYFTSILTTLRSQLYCIPLMLRLRPDLVRTSQAKTADCYKFHCNCCEGVVDASYQKRLTPFRFW
jgi:hypothetical protein